MYVRMREAFATWSQRTKPSEFSRDQPFVKRSRDYWAAVSRSLPLVHNSGGRHVRSADDFRVYLYAEIQR